MTLVARLPLRFHAWKVESCNIRRFATAHRTQASERRAVENLPSTPARTRFAPSPTGYLHLGSLRTAVFNFLVAKATGGQFVLRVEDTDQKRTVPDAYERLYNDLRWAGLQWDEGPEVGGPYGPYIQSERKAIYADAIKQLLKTENVYRCFCSADRLQELAKSMTIAGAAGSYDRRCSHIPTGEALDRAARGEAHVVRLRMPEQPPQFTDLTYGNFRNDASQQRRRKKIAASETGYEDPVIVKSDGLPTYHFANVVDDHHMSITHVIRAAEWLASTPKHIALYEAFGWQPPIFAHVGLLLDEKKQKLSKRTGSQDIRSLRQQGILPEALVNHLALLGWSHRFNDDFMSMNDLVQSFDLKFTKGNVIINDSKLSYLQGKHLATRLEQDPTFLDDIVDQITARVCAPRDNLQPLRSMGGTKSFIRAFLSEQTDRFTNVDEFVDRYFDLFYIRDCIEPPDIVRNYASEVIELVQDAFQEDEEWSVDSVKLHLDVTKDLAGETLGNGEGMTGRKCAKIYWSTLRWALFRGAHGLTVPEIAYYIGQEETFSRLATASKYCKRYKLKES